MRRGFVSASATRRGPVLFYFDLNLLRLCALALRQVNSQDTVLELSLDLLRVRVVGQGEAANEAAVGSFDAVVALVFFFEFALTGDGENPVLDRDFDVLLFYSRQLGFNDVRLIVFGNVGDGRPVRDSKAFASVPLTRSAAKNARETVLQILQFLKWFPAGKCVDHGFNVLIAVVVVSTAILDRFRTTAALLQFRRSTSLRLGNLGSLFQAISRNRQSEDLVVSRN